MHGFLRVLKAADEVGHICLIEDRGELTWFDCFLVGGLTGTTRHIGLTGRGQWRYGPGMALTVLEGSGDVVLTLREFRTGLAELMSQSTYVHGRGTVYRSREIGFQGEVEWDISSERIYPGAYSGPRP